jgi:hypothetical protein
VLGNTLKHGPVGYGGERKSSQLRTVKISMDGPEISKCGNAIVIAFWQTMSVEEPIDQLMMLAGKLPLTLT